MLYPVITMIIVFGILEIKKLLREKDGKEIVLASFLLLIAVLYSIEIHFNVQFLPNPNRIFFLVKPAGDFFMKMLGMP